MHHRNFLERLRYEADERSRIRAVEREAAEARAKLVKSSPQLRQVRPLDDQIVELMRTLPPQLRERPWSMADLVQRLSGKYRDRPHGQQVGEALLRAGWRKERRWERGWDGRRVWLAPTD